MGSILTMNSQKIIVLSLLLSIAGAQASFAVDLPVNQNYFGAQPIIRPTVSEPVSIEAKPVRIDDALEIEDGQKPPVKTPDNNSTEQKTPTHVPSEGSQTSQPESSSMMSPNISYGPIQTNFASLSQLMGKQPTQRGIENLKIVFQTQFDSNRSQTGDLFVASAANDFWADGQLFIPKGTVLRGRIVRADKASFLDKGGELTLDFDHMVLPDGTLKSITYQMLPAISKSVSKSEQLAYTAEQGFQAMQNQTQVGINEAKNKGGGLNYLLAVPTNALLGVATGTLITTSGATKAIFGRAQSVMVQPGDEYEIGRQEVIRLIH